MDNLIQSIYDMTPPEICSGIDTASREVGQQIDALEQAVIALAESQDITEQQAFLIIVSIVIQRRF